VRSPAMGPKGSPEDGWEHTPLWRHWLVGAGRCPVLNLFRPNQLVTATALGSMLRATGVPVGTNGFISALSMFQPMRRSSSGLTLAVHAIGASPLALIHRSSIA